MCQKEQGIEDSNTWLLILSFAISSMGGLDGTQFPTKGPSEPHDQVSLRNKSPRQT